MSQLTICYTALKINPKVHWLNYIPVNMLLTHSLRTTLQKSSLATVPQLRI